jgi:hypothetical protein
MAGTQFKGVRLKKPGNDLGFLGSGLLGLGFLGMTLAAILLLSSFCASSALPTPQLALPALPQTVPQTAAETKQDAAPPPQNPPVQSPPTSPAATPAKKPSGQTQTTTTPRFHHQKRVLPPNCNSAPAAAGQGSSGSTPDSTKSDSSGSSSSPAPADPAAKSPPVNCPPKKVIVRQGGISEPSVQLAGSASGDQKSHAQETANQMLESTKANLKKIAGHQLSTDQQDMVNQTRQFMEQSKAASEAGDLDRARTLAWKAQLLSEELVKPDK